METGRQTERRIPMIDDKPLSIRLDGADNVVVARADLGAGETLPGEGIATAGPVPRGHKVATRAIAKGEPARKFNQIIGFASRDIAPGEHVHTHNLAFETFERDYAYCTDCRDTPLAAAGERRTFEGYVRAGGRVGTRNYIGVLTSVNCSATVARQIAQAVESAGLLAEHPEIDGVSVFGHSTGCGMASTGDGFGNLQRTLSGFARHPNFAGVLLVGLGCEVAQIPALMADDWPEGGGFHAMTIQDTGGTRKTVEEGVARIADMIAAASGTTRQTVPARELMVALQCGGSDAYSGITANPAMGAAVDILVAEGGTAILAETPEI